MKKFLTAEWNHLINITYAVDPEVLKPYLPKGLSLDLIQGKAFVSLVAFEFNSVRVKGMRIPFHTNFPEINLRFYVNQNGKRGVVFIKEFVPKYFVALVANKIYNEPYHSIPMKVRTKITVDQIVSEHNFHYDTSPFNVSVTASNKAYIPEAESMEHFFKEHEIGFGRDKKGNTLSYLVKHPVWEIFPVEKYSLNVNFEKVYGKNWKFLNSTEPHHVLFAKGSEVSVFDKAGML